MPSDNDIYRSFCESLFRDVDTGSQYPDTRPLFAHYTSMINLENIFKNDEFWFSHPLMMNDWQELRFGINESVKYFERNEAIESACQTDEQYTLLKSSFYNCLDRFETKDAFDIYLMCFSEHEQDDQDGLLSMWRGYGQNGHGAAIVIDTSKVIFVEDSPLIIAKVHYMEDGERERWITQKLEQFADLLKTETIQDSQIHLLSQALFERIKMFAIFTKHRGFSEEKEWRVVYMPDRDYQSQLTDMLSYSVGNRGIEPKLKFKIKSIEGVSQELSLEKIVSNIILGPSTSSPLAESAVMRMLNKLGKVQLAEKIVTSGTPYRTI